MKKFFIIATAALFACSLSMNAQKPVKANKAVKAETQTVQQLPAQTATPATQTATPAPATQKKAAQTVKANKNAKAIQAPAETMKPGVTTPAQPVKAATNGNIKNASQDKVATGNATPAQPVQAAKSTTTTTKTSKNAKPKAVKQEVE